MNLIRIFLGFASTFSYFYVEAGDISSYDVGNDGYWQPNDYETNISSYGSDSRVDITEDMACEQQITTDGNIDFPTYPIPPEEACKIYKWLVAVEGYNVDVTINYLDLDATAGDYLIISPGPTLVRDEASVVITGTIQTTKRIRVMDHGKMLVMLVTQKGITSGARKSSGFQLSYKPFGELTTQPPTTTSKPTIPPAPPYEDDDISVYMSGITPSQFHKTKMSSFKESVAEMANVYCKFKNITLLNVTTVDNVGLSFITECPRTWPNWKTCTKVNMTVPVYVGSGYGYELKRKNLEEMWNMYANEMLKNISMQMYQVPDVEETMYVWLYISLGVAVSFTILMLAAWRFDLFNTNSKKGAATPYDPFGRVSTASTDSWISNSYQEVPPMTDLLYDDPYDKTATNQDIPIVITSPNTAAVPQDEPRISSDQFGAAFYFRNRVSNLGYDNPSFDVSSEKRKQNNVDIDDFSSDDESVSGANAAKDAKPKNEHLYEPAPKQVIFGDDNNESAL